jgi:hypothetical protein
VRKPGWPLFCSGPLTAFPRLPHAHPPPPEPGMVSRLPTGGGLCPSDLPAPLHRLPKPAAGPLSKGKPTTTDPKPPDGQAVALVAATHMHPECRGATPLQQSTMPIPLRSWKPRSTPIPKSSRGGTTTSTTMTNPAKTPGGQAAAPVVVADTHPERRSGHPPSANPRQSTTIPGNSSRWKPKVTDPKPPNGVASAPVMDEGVPPEQTPQPAPSPTRQPDGAAVAPGADAGSPPKWIPRIAPSPARWPYEEGGDFEHMGSLSVSGRDTLEGGVMSGELPLTYIMSYSLSLPSPTFPSSTPILYLTGSISTDCDHYGHSHVM